MKTFYIAFCLFITLSFAGADISLGQLGTKELYKRLAPSVVTVVCYDNNMFTTGQGTGFVIDSGYVVINRHTLEGAANAQVRDFRRNKYQVISVVAENDTVDLVLVRLSAGPFAPAVPIASNGVEPGEPIAFVGCPQGLEFSMYTGIVSSVRYFTGEGSVLQLSSEVAPGASGSPVVNMDGELVGIASGRETAEHSVNFAIPSGSIRLLQHHRGVSLREWSRTEKHLTHGSFPKIPPGMGGMETVGSLSSEMLMKHAMETFQKGEYAKAGKEFDNIVRDNPNLEEAWYQLGLCEEYIGHPQHALPAFDKAAMLKRNDKNARLQLGLVLLQLNHPDEAFIQYQEAVRLDTNFAEAWLGLAQASLAQGKPLVATDLSHRAQEKNPEFVAAYLFLGKVLLQQNKVAEAELSFTETMRRFPESHLAAEQCGDYYFLQKNYSEAERLFRRALELDPKCASSTAGVAACWAAQKKFSDAEQQYQKAIALSQNDPNLHLQLGAVYEAMDKTDSEMQEYKTAIGLNPEFADAHLALGLAAVRKAHNTPLALEEYHILKELDATKARELFSEIYK